MLDRVLKRTSKCWRRNDRDTGYVSVKVGVKITKSPLKDFFGFLVSYRVEGSITREAYRSFKDYETAELALRRLRTLCKWIASPEDAMQVFGQPDTPPFGWVHLPLQIVGCEPYVERK